MKPRQLVAYTIDARFFRQFLVGLGGRVTVVVNINEKKLLTQNFPAVDPNAEKLNSFAYSG